MGIRTHNFESILPVWRFGNSRAKETSGFAEQDRYIRLSDNYFLGALGR